ncbi:hypothetical protein BACPU_15880 [Bacillus pumilus]|nr:hypothetical protein BACPU_15880 [Bacillus pumilus]
MNTGLFESFIRNTLKEEFDKILHLSLINEESVANKTYLTMNEINERTKLTTYTLGDLIRRRAMPHLRVKSRIIFIEEEILPTINHYKKHGWTDPDDFWSVSNVIKEVEDLRNDEEEPELIEEAIRKIISDELEVFSDEIKNLINKNNNKVHTLLTVKEAANYFRVSTSTIFSLIHEDEMPHMKMGSKFIIVLEEAEAFLWRETARKYADTGNIYWTRILERIDYEEKKRKVAFDKAMERIGNS